MNKTLREKLIRKHEEMKDSMPSLYNMRWVEKAATDGWNQIIKDMEKTEPKLAEAARSQKGYNVLAVIYFTSFENALNTFFSQCMDDTLTTVSLCLDELRNVTAEMKEDLDGLSK